MPKTPINYENTIIYKIVCKDLSITDCYVGHTTDFIRRKQQHKNCCDNQNNKKYYRKVYKYIRDNGGWDNFDMIMIEKYSCKNKYEAHSRERYWIETLNAKLNIAIPTRTKQEYCKDNKDEIKEYRKIYYEDNKDDIIEKSKAYYKDNIVEIKEYRKIYYQDNKDDIIERSKAYYEENKNKVLESQKKYTEENKNKILAYKKLYREKNAEKIKEPNVCDCGGHYTNEHKTRHLKSIIHQNFLKQQK
jgi:hypothetical protein